MLNGLLAFTLSAFSAAPIDWSVHALRLSGEGPRIRNEATRQLKRYPHLKAALRKALREQKRPLALDVIAALEMKDLLPELSLLSKENEDGTVYLAMNALIDTANRDGFIELYLKRLKDSRISGPSQSILLDTLGRLGARIPRRELENFLNSPRYEVARHALYYLRLMILTHHQHQYKDLVRQAAHLRPRQLRDQASSLIAEIEACK